ncbi:iron ABC transporter permease [Chelatococcus sp. SYSU_G07232]|uniref:Iron ABC transporter permease n=1 Tax=Chelatococcus albus TaxID=3047466 RepID=A0ABT7AJN6_9HYPH|nr:iron ABC transporter permease [Chelatococcus sp. SYSU_G07232]MDJ1159600.1 iron ABC transporter permease [Chelatococcus sp. SYSU_G07232]
MTAIAPEAAQSLAAAVAGRRKRTVATFSALSAACLLVVLLSIGTGAVKLSPAQVLDILLSASGGVSDPATAGHALVVVNIRLPRILVGLMVGAALAVSGALMQGLFRNPLADPGLVGVSAGAGLAAAATIVLGDRLLAAGALPTAALPGGAFAGGLAVTALLYGMATRQGRTSIAVMLLAGVAIGALAGSLMGLLSYISDDRQLRDVTFWMLGSLGGASWSKVTSLAPAVLPVLVAVPFLARGLNALVLGEAEAFHLGMPVQRLKRLCIVLVALAVGASVAVSGIIGFVGIVVPHVLRLALGADHRVLLPGSALLGGTLLVGADMLARTIVAPAELPIGILTSLLGAPFFLWLLLKRGGSFEA